MAAFNIVQADYNNDEWMDFLVMRGGWMFARGMVRVSLLRNNANGTFTDVTAEAGLAYPAYPSQSAAWADFDNDGDPDLYLSNFGTQNRLYRNDTPENGRPSSPAK